MIVRKSISIPPSLGLFGISTDSPSAHIAKINELSMVKRWIGKYLGLVLEYKEPFVAGFRIK